MSRLAMAAMRAAKWGLMAEVAAAATVAGGRVVLVGLLLLFILMLLSKVATIGFVDSPRHMVLAPIKGIFPNFLPFLALPRLGRLFLPCLIFLLFPFV